MNALTPLFRFHNISGVESMSYSLSRGIQPGVCTVQIPATSQIDRREGTMYISDGIRSVQFSECIISDAPFEIGGDGGQSTVLGILDRRWKWQFGQISGRYNIRTAGQLQPATKRTPRQLAGLLFEAMGEKRFNISRMPNDTFPHVDWDLDNPARMLDELCGKLNCHICLGWDDVVYVFQDGDGRELPNVPSSSAGIGFDFGVRPGAVGIASGLFQWQFDFPLIPYGLDANGVIKPIDELSYRPKTDGWKYVVPATMNGIQSAKYAKTDERKLAKETVWRWFRIGKPVGISKMPIANLPIVSERQFFPLLTNQLEFETLTESAKAELKDAAYDRELRQRLPHQVWGLFYDESGTGADNVEKLNVDEYIDLNKKKTDSLGEEKLVYAKLIYPKSFSVDQDRRLIVFADPVYRVINDGPNSYYAPPKLYLRTACNFYHPLTRAGYRLQKTIPVGGPDSNLVDWQSQEDIVPEWRKTGKSTFQYNGKEVEQSLNYYLGYAVRKYQSKIPAHIEVPWLLPFSPDGRIAQVTFSIDGQGFISTAINKEIEGLDTPVTYAERRRDARIAASQDRLAKLYGNGRQDDSKGK